MRSVRSIHLSLGQKQGGKYQIKCLLNEMLLVALHLRLDPS